MNGEAVDPMKALIRRYSDEVIPQVEQQRDPSRRKAMVARLEEELRGALKVLDEKAKELRETRRRCAELFKAARRLRPRGKPRLPRDPARSQPTAEQKEAVLDALRKRGSVAMSELCYATGLGMARLKRILQALGREGKVERSGTTSATRYRFTGRSG